MKIRTGFVSNSSSSSFCLIGVPINQDDIYSGKLVWEPGIVMLGGHTGDGVIIQDLTKEKYDLLVHSITILKCKDSVTFLRRAIMYDDGTPLGPHRSGAVVYCGETAQFTPDIDDFEDMFINGEGIEFY